MRIQEKMVKMLNKESLDDARLNYPNSSSTTTLKQFVVAFKKICWFITFILFVCRLISFYFSSYRYITICLFVSLKMAKKNADGVPETFKSFIQNSKFERERRRRVQNVQLDDTLDHYIWNGLDNVQYKVIVNNLQIFFLKKILPRYFGYRSWLWYPKHWIWYWALYLPSIQ